MPNLTPSQVLAMEAGTELDALVAERVMGFDINRRTKYIAGKRVHPDDWSPSYDIAAAWEVVEKDKRLTPRWDIYYDEDCGQSGPTWVVRYDTQTKRCSHCDYKSSGDIVVIIAPTAPLAICRAALLTTL